MLNIPFLRKLAKAFDLVGWIGVTWGVALAAVSGVARYRLQHSAEAGQAFHDLPSTMPFPWSMVAREVLLALAVGIILMAAAQLIHLAIKVLEHLRNLDGVEAAAEGEPEGTRFGQLARQGIIRPAIEGLKRIRSLPEEEPTPKKEETESAVRPTAAELGQAFLDLPRISPSSRFLSRAALFLGWGIIIAGALSILLAYVPLDARKGEVVGSLQDWRILGLSATGLVAIRSVSYALIMLLVSQALLWGREALGHLRSLAEWEAQPEVEQATEDQP